eukprot:SAG31_NODE_12939_length_905_cov_1.260546_1_plen_166_part_00
MGSAASGAIKSRWPALRTIAALDWPVMPDDLPVDVWVDLYSDYFCDSMAGSDCGPGSSAKAAQRKRWLAGGGNQTKRREYWWCVTYCGTRHKTVCLRHPTSWELPPDKGIIHPAQVLVSATTRPALPQHLHRVPGYPGPDAFLVGVPARCERHDVLPGAPPYRRP